MLGSLALILMALNTLSLALFLLVFNSSYPILCRVSFFLSLAFCLLLWLFFFCFFFQAEDGIRDDLVTGVQTCALPISLQVTCLRGHHLVDQRSPDLRRSLAVAAVGPFAVATVGSGQTERRTLGARLGTQPADFRIALGLAQALDENPQAVYQALHQEYGAHLDRKSTR